MDAVNLTSREKCLSPRWESLSELQDAFEIKYNIRAQGDMPDFCAELLPKIPPALTSQFSRLDQV